MKKAVGDLKVGDGEEAGTSIGPIINSRWWWSIQCNDYHQTSFIKNSKQLKRVKRMIIFFYKKSRLKRAGNWRGWRELWKKVWLPEPKLRSKIVFILIIISIVNNLFNIIIIIILVNISIVIILFNIIIIIIYHLCKDVWMKVCRHNRWLWYWLML